MIDLQLHTTDSDGTWSWTQVLEHCVEIGLTAFAITDHDTMVRRDAVEQWGQERQVMAIPGIELSTRDRGETVHLLGYFLDGDTQTLETRLEFLQNARRDRNAQIIERLQSLGFSITEDDVKRVAGSGTMGRPHIARVLMENGSVKSIKEAFDRFLSLGGKAYFPKEELPFREALDLLHGAGAVTSVAHPLLLKRNKDELESSFKEWASWGLDGLESVYPVYTVEQTAYMNRMTTKYNLLMTGGSDFHGANKPHIKIGVGTGDLNVPDELLEPLLKKRAEINNTINTLKN